MEQLPRFECQIHNKGVLFICNSPKCKQKSRLLCGKCTSSNLHSNNYMIEIDEFLSDIVKKQGLQTLQEKQIQDLIGYKNENFQNALKIIKIILENYFELEKIELSRENYQEHITNLLQRDNQEFLLSVFSQQESNFDKRIKEQMTQTSLKHDKITEKFQKFVNDIDTQQDKKFAELEVYYKKKISELEQKLGQCESQLAQEKNKTNQSNQLIQQNQSTIPTIVQFSQQYKKNSFNLSEGNQVATAPRGSVGSVFIEQPLNYNTSTYFEVKVEKSQFVGVGIHSKLGDKGAINSYQGIDYCYLPNGDIYKKGQDIDYGQKSQFNDGDTVGVYLNQSEGILKFYVNGTHNGAAVQEISLKQQTYYAVVHLSRYDSVRFLGFKPCPNQ